MKEKLSETQDFVAQSSDFKIVGVGLWFDNLEGFWLW